MRNAAARIALLLAAVTHGAATADTASGQVLFQQKCAACHTIGEGDRIGPDLHDVGARRERAWLMRFVTDPQAMIAAGDPVAVRLYERYNRIVMPNLALDDTQASALLAHIDVVSRQRPASAAVGVATAPMPAPALRSPQSAILYGFIAATLLIVTVFVWVARSTRDPATVDTHRAYALRRVLFMAGLVCAITVLALTLPRTPYVQAATTPDRVIHVTARQFEFLFSDVAVDSTGDLLNVATSDRITVAADTLVEFRVTALDVNHGFGVYGGDRQLLAQTQAMPGYVNRVRVHFREPGHYPVLCLEYCAAGHHLMRAGITVE